MPIRVPKGDEIETVVVDVGGAVIEPGVVELDAGSRVADAIEAAGGPRNRCGLHHIEPGAASPGWSEVYVPEGGRIDASGALVDSSTQEAGQAATTLVNINTADIAGLSSLSGIGEATAKKIIADREKNGPFKTTKDITRVSGDRRQEVRSYKRFDHGIAHASNPRTKAPAPIDAPFYSCPLRARCCFCGGRVRGRMALRSYSS